MRKLLELAAVREASDLHLKAGSPPCIRVDGRLIQLGSEALSSEHIDSLAFSLMDERQKKRLEIKHEVDFAFSLPDGTRFRANCFKQRGATGIALRRVVTRIPTIAELGLPVQLEKLAEEARGLVLVTGTAGSGKTTTVAAMIDHINSTRRCHVVTIEDPIEVSHRDRLAIIDQREIGPDTDSYEDALKNVVRQDPDVLQIGEMRDAETIQAALTAAEIGNLVLSTLHTIDARETINRIIDYFPPHQQKQIRIMLAHVLKGIVSLRLLPRVGGGRVPAVELMICTATIQEYILQEELTTQILEAIEQGDYYGMRSFDQSLLSLYSEGKVTLEDATAMASHQHDFLLKVKQAGLTAPQAPQTSQAPQVPQASQVPQAPEASHTQQSQS